MKTIPSVSERRTHTITVRPPEAGVNEVHEYIEQMVDNLLWRWERVRGSHPFHRHTLTLEVRDEGITRVSITGTICAS